MTEQPKPQRAPATREEMANAMHWASGNAFGRWSVVAELVASWLAAERAQALEDAAKIADSNGGRCADDPYDCGFENACELIAGAIREQKGAAR